MLIQLPRGSAPAQANESSSESEGFEAGLRRDLASAPLVSYDSTLGGWSKRAVDVAATLLLAPVWLPLTAAAALVARMRRAAPVFVATDRIGYGGRVYRCFAMRRFDAPSAVVTPLHPETEQAQVADTTPVPEMVVQRASKWREVFERLPQFVNVLRGDMSLVGPLPLSREQLEPLRTAKRYYLSARPGLVGISAIADANEEEAGQYKIYTLSWSLMTDALIVWEALQQLIDGGKTRRPAILRATPEAPPKPVFPRGRPGKDAA